MKTQIFPFLRDKCYYRKNGTGKSTFINILSGRKIAYQSDAGIVKTNKIKNGILLIDEIENGFYYELYDQLLKIFCETALKNNCQIRSSHSRT